VFSLNDTEIIKTCALYLLNVKLIPEQTYVCPWKNELIFIAIPNIYIYTHTHTHTHTHTFTDALTTLIALLLTLSSIFRPQFPLCLPHLVGFAIVLC